MNSKQWICAEHEKIRHRNNHNSGWMHDEEVMPSSSSRPVRKRLLSESSRLSVHPLLLILIRSVILLVMLWTVYSAFLSIYPKPSRTVWTRLQQTLTGAIDNRQ